MADCAAAVDAAADDDDDVDDDDDNDGSDADAICIGDDEDVANSECDMVDTVSSCVNRCVIAIGLYPLNAFRGFGKLPGTTDPCNGSDS